MAGPFRAMPSVITLWRAASGLPLPAATLWRVTVSRKYRHTAVYSRRFQFGSAWHLQANSWKRREGTPLYTTGFWPWSSSLEAQGQILRPFFSPISNMEMGLHQGSRPIRRISSSFRPKEGEQDNGGVTRQPLRACRGRHSRRPVSPPRPAPGSSLQAHPLPSPRAGLRGHYCVFTPTRHRRLVVKTCPAKRFDMPPACLTGQGPVTGRGRQAPGCL